MRRRLGILSAVVLSMLVITFGEGCKKHRVDPARELDDEARSQRWDPPTAQFGFRPVGRAECVPHDAGRFTKSSRGTIEEVAQRSRPIQSVATDAEAGGSGPIYFTESDPLSPFQSSPAPPRGSVHVAIPASPSPITARGAGWRVLDIATDESDPGEIAVSSHRVYWTARNKSNPDRFDIRVLNRRSSVVRSSVATSAPPLVYIAEQPAGEQVNTLTTEDARPSRILSHGRHVFWMTGRHIRQVSDDNGGSSRIHERYTGTLTPGLLAADDEAVYAFTGDRSLLRIPIAGGPATVLVSTTDTTPTDLAVNGSWVYWLEAGKAMERCTKSGAYPCHHGYQLASETPFLKGSLRRIPTTGIPATGIPTTGTPANGTPANGIPANGILANGILANGMPANGMPANGTKLGGALGAELVSASDVVATDLPDVATLTFLAQSPWLTRTNRLGGGPVRIAPRAKFEDHIELTTELDGRPIHPNTRLVPHGHAALAMATIDQGTTPSTSRLIRLHSF